jgi:hypothetical protein
VEVVSAPSDQADGVPEMSARGLGDRDRASVDTGREGQAGPRGSGVQGSMSTKPERLEDVICQRDIARNEWTRLRGEIEAMIKRVRKKDDALRLALNHIENYGCQNYHAKLRKKIQQAISS